MSFKPFEFILNLDKRATLEERVEQLGDTIKVIVVNLLRVAEHCENRFTALEESLRTIELKISNLEQEFAYLKEKIRNKPLTVKNDSIDLNTAPDLNPPPLVIPNVASDFKKKPVSNETLRRDIISELKRVFNERKQAEMSEDN